MLTSTLVSSHTDGSGSGVSVSSGADVLGAGLVAEEDVLGTGAGSLVEALGEVSPVGSVDAVDSVADGEADVSAVSSPVGVPVVETLGVAVGSVAYAAGAARRATGAITAVAAAAAMARRSFMKTSVSPVCRGVRHGLGGAFVWGAGVMRDVSEFDPRRPWMVVLPLTEFLCEVDHP
ncbi:hypothetical protein GCM10010398_41310 [Streptomyces fimbriatus]